MQIRGESCPLLPLLTLLHLLHPSPCRTPVKTPVV